ncbi:MAG: DUF3848 domain-containing protein [Eubacteriaceae bacterium]|nr:DUF3848 domain-containing protein [Eubacteriaceae bacterium]
MSYKLLDQLLDKLYDLIENEQRELKDELRILSPDEIISRAYEIATKEDIAMMLECEELDVSQLKVLVKEKYPLDSIYSEWLKRDYSHMEYLRETMFSHLRKETERHMKTHDRRGR